MSDLPERSAANSTTSDARGDRATLVLRRLLRHPPATVWRAITDPDQIRQWFLTTAKIDGRVGGEVDMTTGPDGVHATGRVLAWDPPRLFEYEWNVTDPNNRLFTGERSRVSWELTPAESGTMLVLTHRDLTRKTAAVFELGLSVFLGRLEAQLDGRELPDWERGVQEARRLGFVAKTSN
jgi:uncharacterized protein YndB with AHSA1/START domain